MLFTELNLAWHIDTYMRHSMTIELTTHLAQLAGAVEYTDCIYAEGYDSPNKCPRYDAKQPDGEAPVMLELWGM